MAADASELLLLEGYALTGAAAFEQMLVTQGYGAAPVPAALVLVSADVSVPDIAHADAKIAPGQSLTKRAPGRGTSGRG